MNHILYINNMEFRQFRDSIYYVSEFGHIYSTYVNRIIYPLQRKTRGKIYYYIDIWNEELQKQQHIPLHHIVWIAWVGEIPYNYQINHIDDCTDDNWLENLYMGSQKENINDCKSNNHRCGNIYILKIYDKLINKELTFCPASNFIEYSGHSSSNGGIARMLNRKWFKERYTILEYRPILNVYEYKSVTTNG